MVAHPEPRASRRKSTSMIVLVHDLFSVSALHWDVAISLTSCVAAKKGRNEAVQCPRPNPHSIALEFGVY